ncbi:ribonuclease E inhibitor RraB [Terriglobus sp. TAA 43]|uniref:ribonuclease E inhibitor RraB n=1 Tax=Terriglobus sp. TAA 43 TaxID=278961 RepID=UPI00064869E9|nr:ribonuclease E inhibitor RraB [Terriglobus sp. TAA 43]
MATHLREKENFDQQSAYNSVRIKELIDQQYNVEVTRSLVLCFSCQDQDCAYALSKALFAKGTRILTRDPKRKANGRWGIRVGVKRSLRDAVREEFVADMVLTATGMNGTYDGWNLLTDEAAEETQKHPSASVIPQERRQVAA